MKIIGETQDPVDNSMTPEEQYQWYLRIKQDLPQLRRISNVSELEKAIIEYEHRKGIK